MYKGVLKLIVKITRVKKVNNGKFHIIGVLFMILNWVRHSVFGYQTPRTFSNNQIEKAVDYDFNVVSGWLKYFQEYLKVNDIKGKVILELGPGPDLGTGLILLAMGAKKYIALDVHNLASSVSANLYAKLFDVISIRIPECDVDYLKEQLNLCLNGEVSNLQYVVDKDFKMEKISDVVDVVFSQAAFEHFIDVEKVVCDLNNIIIRDCVLVVEIDMKTHTRWIKDEDPLNIYRYSEFFWNLLKFKGSPNRLRAFEYKDIFLKMGWDNIEIVPMNVLEDEYVSKVKCSLNKRFQKMELAEMKMLSIMLITKK